MESVKKMKEPKNVKEKKPVSDAVYAKLKAEEIRTKDSVRKNLQPGDVLGGDLENWVYFHCPGTEPEASRYKAVKLNEGYEECTRGESMVGFASGSLWRLPRVIREERREKARQKLKG